MHENLRCSVLVCTKARSACRPKPYELLDLLRLTFAEEGIPMDFLSH